MVSIIIVLCLLMSVSIPSLSATDYSKWSYFDLADTASRMAGEKNFQGALKFFDLAVKTAPNNPEAYLNRGAMYGILHESQKAIEDELRAIELAKGDTGRNFEIRFLAHKNLSDLYLKANQLVKAEAEARTALKLQPNNPSAEEILAATLQRTGKAHEALLYYLKAKAVYEKEGTSAEVAKVDEQIRVLQSKTHIDSK